MTVEFSDANITLFPWEGNSLVLLRTSMTKGKIVSTITGF